MSLHNFKLQFISLIALAIAGVGALSIAAAPTAQARIDNTPDCDTVAIIKCGAFSESALKKAYDKDAYGDIKKVYNAFDISRSDLSGFKSGIVYRNGDVEVNGKVVATNAMTAGRNYGGTKISGTKGAGKYSVSKFVDEGQTAFVKMKDGKFEFAIIKACGNPISATPKKTAKPKPAPQPVAKTVTKVKVCNPATGATIKVDEEDADQYKPVGDEACTDMEVCRLRDQQTVTIKGAQFDTSKYSQDPEDCEAEEEPEAVVATQKTTKAPRVIASTGPEQFVLGGLGLGSLTAAGYYFRTSRRTLIDKILGK